MNEQKMSEGGEHSATMSLTQYIRKYETLPLEDARGDDGVCDLMGEDREQTIQELIEKVQALKRRWEASERRLPWRCFHELDTNEDNPATSNSTRGTVRVQIRLLVFVDSIKLCRVRHDTSAPKDVFTFYKVSSALAPLVDKDPVVSVCLPPGVSALGKRSVQIREKCVSVALTMMSDAATLVEIGQQVSAIHIYGLHTFKNEPIQIIHYNAPLDRQLTSDGRRGSASCNVSVYVGLGSRRVRDAAVRVSRS